MSVVHRFIATNPVVTKDANSDKIRIRLEVTALEGYPAGSEIALVPAFSEYLLDTDSAAELLTLLQKTQSKTT